MCTHFRSFSTMVLGLGCLLSLSSDAGASGMQCGNRLVSKGDPMYRVRSLCGEPADAQRRIETRTERRRVAVPCRARGEGREAYCERTVEHAVDVVVDEWAYDFGSRRFVRYLTFLDGRLAQVETGGYGSRTDR